MDPAPLALALTPLGHLVLAPEAGAPPLEAAAAGRLGPAFQRGAGHGLLQLGAAEAGIALPPVFAYWREFGARYVTALCTQPEGDRQRKKVHVPPPSDEELEWIVLGAPPMAGAEYLEPNFPNPAAGCRSF
jgi:non-specific serine/threonine protein kinase